MSVSSVERSTAWVRAHWPRIRKVAVAGFICMVVVMLGMAATRVEWVKVLDAVDAMPGRALWLAGLIAAASYMVYGGFDVLGKLYTGHELAWWKSLAVGCISYAFTMSLGAPVGGVGLRLRLYGRMGLKQGIILRVMAFSLASNWMGYMVLSGVVLAAGAVSLPTEWNPGEGALRAVGVLMVVAALAYPGVCGFSKVRSRTVWGHEIDLPPPGVALTQLAIGALNWMLIAAVIYMLMQQKVAYAPVLGALLISAIGGVLVRIPGGLGVIETVFMTLLASPSLSRYEILGAVLAYRAVYYIVPLLLAGVLYLAIEAGLERESKTDTPDVRCTNYPYR
ncbi:MAG: UPF0104 family protein [Burkholderiaceae bacterium]